MGVWLFDRYETKRVYSAFPKFAGRVGTAVFFGATVGGIVTIADAASFQLKGLSVVGWWMTSEAMLTLVASREAVALAKAVIARSASLAILADWIEDDVQRVRTAYHHTREAVRLDEDAVSHFLTLMRSHRPTARRLK